MNDIVGSFTMMINGATVYVTDGVLKAGGWDVTQVRAGTQVAGNRKVRTFPSFTGNVPKQAGTSIVGLAELDQAEVTIQTDTGDVYQMFGATATDPTGELSESDGMIKIDLRGTGLLPVNEG